MKINEKGCSVLATAFDAKKHVLLDSGSSHSRYQSAPGPGALQLTPTPTLALALALALTLTLIIAVCPGRAYFEPVKRKLICMLTPLLALWSPGLTVRGEAANVVGQEATKVDTGPTYFQVPSDHAAMHRAVTDARRTVGKFVVALKHPAPGRQDFEVKKPFIQGNQVEHIWLSDVQFVGNRFQGKVDNQPRKIHGVKLGQLVSVNPNEISDWMYIDKGKLIGGYTIRVRYNELSPAQKQQFDTEADFKLGSQ